jgi:hypothetical protein
MTMQSELLRCPACGTVFRGPGSLPAHGRVRCGVCDEVFVAQPAPAPAVAGLGGVAPRPAHASWEPASTPGAGATLLRGGLLLLLLLALLAQGIWLARQRLAEVPRLRPVLASACERLGCTLPVFRDLTAIQVVDARVTSHPDYAGALLAVVTLDNTAALAQPWPRLAVALTGADDAAVAERLFEAADYLPAERQGEREFAAGASVQLRLPLADPGLEAAGFRFTLH